MVILFGFVIVAILFIIFVIVMIREGGAAVREASATSRASSAAKVTVAPTWCPAALCPFCGVQLSQSGTPWLLDKLVDALPQAHAGGTGTASAPAAASPTLGILLAAAGPGDRVPTTLALGKNLRVAVEQICSRDKNFSEQRFVRWATQEYMANASAQTARRWPCKRQIYLASLSTTLTRASSSSLRRIPARSDSLKRLFSRVQSGR